MTEKPLASVSECRAIAYRPGNLKRCVNDAGLSQDVLESLRTFLDRHGRPTCSTRPLYDVRGDRHDAFMQFPWQKSRDGQLGESNVTIAKRMKNVIRLPYRIRSSSPRTT
jgi:hypothetical protein